MPIHIDPSSLGEGALVPKKLRLAAAHFSCREREPLLTCRIVPTRFSDWRSEIEAPLKRATSRQKVLFP